MEIFGIVPVLVSWLMSALPLRTKNSLSLVGFMGMDLQDHENFIGVYEVKSIYVDNPVHTIKDTRILFCE